MFFFFKQKTAYEIPSSDWSSDVCSSDLRRIRFEQFDDAGRWTGALSARDVATLPTDRAAEMCGPAGTVVLIHCRVVHASAANYSARLRPLLLNVYSAADTLPMTPAPSPTKKTGVLVRDRKSVV